MENITKYKLLGGRIKLKQGTVPHKFKCQQEKEDGPQRSAMQKRNFIEYFKIFLNKVETSTLTVIMLFEFKLKNWREYSFRDFVRE